MHNLEELEGAIKDNTKAVYIETLGNPNSDIPDIEAIAKIAHKHGLPLVIDNTSALRTSSARSSTVLISLFTLLPSSSAVTARPSVVSSLIPASSTGSASGKYAPIAEPTSYHSISLQMQLVLLLS